MFCKPISLIIVIKVQKNYVSNIKNSIYFVKHKFNPIKVAGEFSLVSGIVLIKYFLF